MYVGKMIFISDRYELLSEHDGIMMCGAVIRVRDAKGIGFADSAKRSGARERQRTPQQPDPARRVSHSAAGGGTPQYILRKFFICCVFILAGGKCIARIDWFVLFVQKTAQGADR
jgi:hypothetical protein